MELAGEHVVSLCCALTMHQTLCVLQADPSLREVTAHDVKPTQHTGRCRDLSKSREVWGCRRYLV